MLRPLLGVVLPLNPPTQDNYALISGTDDAVLAQPVLSPHHQGFAAPPHWQAVLPVLGFWTQTQELHAV